MGNVLNICVSCIQLCINARIFVSGLSSSNHVVLYFVDTNALQPIVGTKDRVQSPTLSTSCPAQSGSSKRKLKRHLIKSPQICLTCGASFTYLKAFDKHKKRHCNDEEKECVEFGKQWMSTSHHETFSEQQKENISNKRVSLNTDSTDIPHQSEGCKKTKECSVVLDRIDSGNKHVHTCRKCGKAFPEMALFSKHLVSHYKRKPLKSKTTANIRVKSDGKLSSTGILAKKDRKAAANKIQVKKIMKLTGKKIQVKKDRKLTGTKMIRPKKDRTIVTKTRMKQSGKPAKKIRVKKDKLHKKQVNLSSSAISLNKQCLTLPDQDEEINLNENTPRLNPKVARPNKQTLLKCTDCHKYFLHLAHLRGHCCAKQDMKETYSCEKCGEEFLSKMQLDKHMIPRSRKCSTCCEWFISISELEAHILTHLPRCPVCLKVFGVQSHLDTHVRMCQASTENEERS